MKLGKKTMLYSLALGVLVTLLLMVYMVILLPTLHVDYQETVDRDAVKSIHMATMKGEGPAKKEMERRSGSAISIRIPENEDAITFFSQFARGTVRIKDEKVNTVFRRCKQRLFDMGKTGELSGRLKEEVRWDSKQKKMIIQDPQLRQDIKTLGAYLKNMQQQIGESTGLETDIQWTKYESTDGEIDYQLVGKNTVMIEMGITDTSQKAEYTSYILFSIRGDEIYITLASGVIPRISDLLPVILQNLPVILAVLFLVVLAGSMWFSKKLVNPVIRIQQYASAAQKEKERNLSPPEIKGKDEIAKLAENVRDLYETKQRQYQQLSKISQRKEVFLRASSHQLKTPIAAAMLLVDGMIQKVGRYGNYETYLPKVREQLQSMQHMVQDILHMSRAGQDPVMTVLPMEEMVDNMLKKWEIQYKEKELEVQVEGEARWKNDEEMLGHILDNLVGNAVRYTKRGGRIRILVSGEEIRIENAPAHIEESLLPVVKEPFVSGSDAGNAAGTSHGLGLYLADFYAGMLGMECRIENTEGGVAVTLVYERKEKEDAGV